MKRIQELMDAGRPVKWLFYGDSITHGALHTFGWRDYTELFAERIRWELRRVRDVVINTGISGQTTRDLLGDFDWRVVQFRPDVVFVMIGMNDCSSNRGITAGEFRKNLDELADRIGAAGALTVLQTTNPIMPGTSPDREPGFDGCMDAIRAVAADRGLPLVDHTAHWRANREKHPFWMSDAFHPNEYGHRVFAQCIFRALGIHEPAGNCSRLFVP